MAWWLMPQTPDPVVGGSSPTQVKPCCVLEQGTFTPYKVLVIPRKRWLRPNMTEQLFTRTLRKNQSTNNRKLICVFVFAYAKSRFSHNEAHLILHHVVKERKHNHSFNPLETRLIIIQKHGVTSICECQICATDLQK